MYCVLLSFEDLRTLEFIGPGSSPTITEKNLWFFFFKKKKGEEEKEEEQEQE